MSFGQGLSGLNAASQNLDVIGNNIANSATVGFKAASVSFADVYANSRVGLGVQVAAINQRFNVGNITSTGGSMDMAIDGANGFFVLQDPSGAISYSRNGEFNADKDQYIVNSQGQRLMGYVQGSAELTPIRVPVGNIAPQASTNVDLKANFDANAPIISETDIAETIGEATLTDSLGATASVFFRKTTSGDFSWVDATGSAITPPADGDYTDSSGNTITLQGGQISSGVLAADVDYSPAIVGRPFDPKDPETFTHSLPITVYDSLGNSHQMTQYFVKRDGAAGTQSQWDTYYRLDGIQTNIPSGGGPIPMTFNSAGLLTSNPIVSVAVNQPGTAGSPAEPLNVQINLAGSTQFGGEFTPSFIQNGYATGEYIGMSVSSDGSILASYTNGEAQVMGHIALANFNNVNGLQPVGGNAWVETGESGQPITGRPGENGLAQIKGQALEESNVEMSSELVNMIIAQRNYQANAQTIKTQDQILQTLMQMR